VICWGANGSGQAAFGGNFVAVSAGGLHTCGMLSSGDALCWGANGDGQAEVPDSFN
jgi:hypothetical protein